MTRTFKGIGVALCLFVAVYGPAFLITALIRPRITTAIPMVIIISLSVACAIMIALSRRRQGLVEFGFRLPRSQYVWSSLVLGIVLGSLIGYIAYLFPTKPAYDVSKFTPTLIVVYFVLAASVQEEIVFRGLLQTVVARIFVGGINVVGGRVGVEVLIVAALFCFIHIPEGPAVIAGALLLGLFAGELRRRSGSVLPAILVHTLFNVGSAIFEPLARLTH